jgi:hypothetical protein
MKGKKMLGFLLVLIIFILVVNAFALHYFLYWRLLWLDIPMHFLGGFWLGLGALWLYFLSGRFDKAILPQHRKNLYVIALALTSGLVIGGMWEIYEFSLDLLIRLADVYYLQDTAGDIVMDALGSLSAASIFIIGNYHNQV